MPTVETVPKGREASWFNKLGPGLITGAADDDPSGIATYSQAGAQFGLNMLWTVLFTYPLMVGIQVVSARIGRVSGHGLATNIRRHYPAWLLYSVVGLLLIANTINIAADVSAMGEALKLIVGGPAQLYAVAFGVVSLLLQVFIPYRRYVRILKWLTLALLAYVATAFVVHIPWSRVLVSALAPHMSWKREYITTVVAVFGTTISPYLFFWQASQEVEDQLALAADAVLARAASFGTPPPQGWQAEVDRGAAATFPITAADLMPDLQGEALGQRLKAMEARWLASGLTATRDDLLNS